MTILNRPEKAITVGQLRQNPTAMIHDVADGDHYVLTDHGRPVARIAPYSEPTWVSTADVMALLNAPTDPDWLGEVQGDRASSDMKDPWAG